MNDRTSKWRSHGIANAAQGATMAAFHVPAEPIAGLTSQAPTALRRLANKEGSCR